MSDGHDVPKMVAIYKRLFLVLVGITVLGIGLAFLHLPIWLAVVIALAIILFKGVVVLDSFKHLLTGRTVLILTFTLTAVFFASVILLPCLNHEGFIRGTEDISKQIQAEQKPVEAHHGD